MFGGNWSFHSNFRNGQFIFTTALVVNCLGKWFWQKVSNYVCWVFQIHQLHQSSIKIGMHLLSLLLGFETCMLYKLFETIINHERYIIEINCAQVYIVFFITQGNVTYFSQHKIGFLSIMYSVKYLSWSQCH